MADLMACSSAALALPAMRNRYLLPHGADVSPGFGLCVCQPLQNGQLTAAIPVVGSTVPLTVGVSVHGALLGLDA